MVAPFTAVVPFPHALVSVVKFFALRRDEAVDDFADPTID